MNNQTDIDDKEAIFRRILIVDDSLESCKKYISLIQDNTYKQNMTKKGKAIVPIVIWAHDGEEALFLIESSFRKGTSIDVVVTDLFMPITDGIWLINKLIEKGFSSNNIDIVLLSDKDDAIRRTDEIESAEKSWSRNTKNKITKVFRAETNQEEEFLTAIWSGIWKRLDCALKKYVNILNTIDIGNDSWWREKFITNHEPLIEQINKILKISNSSQLNVSIIGPPGSGKEIMAEILHDSSNRKNNNLLKMSVKDIPPHLLESAFFGHKKGAYTGAETNRVGLFQAADNGTLFIDEIGEMELQYQSMLLRALQEKVVIPVGDNVPVKVDTKVLVASSRDLISMVKKDEFNEALATRLALVSIKIPPLNERREDIPELISYFWNKKNGRHEEWEKSAVEYVAGLDFSFGNVRRLHDIIESLNALHPKQKIVKQKDIENLPINIEFEFYGLDKLKTFNNRAAHIIFFPLLLRALKKDLSKREAKIFIVENAYTKWGQFFPDGGENNSKKEKIGTLWTEHYRLSDKSEKCETCREIWYEKYGK